ncbi:hypothetical protein [Marinobacterium lutimaris]|uniref:Uncharacterized protein n=1 Tax=Marinobacterium lutimaris TaxID=568106 RepID=A0A1H5VAJ5_9GAMM|nr:hypothetical protein [Marinobacterium lutimaris]SEF84349.1 hypothetical protein SAMN05444390_101675 [Marinobacterium lutimaris]
MINIASFTFQFDLVEDRIRLVGNLDNGEPRVDFWLTRRLALRILGASDELVQHTSKRVSESPPEFRDATAQFEHEQARERMEVTNQPIPATDSKGPELLHRIDISHRNGRYQLRLFGQDDPDEVAASGVLTYDELHQVLHLIHTGADRLGWDAPPLFTAFGREVSPTLQ